MSSNVFSTGIMVPLKVKMTNEQKERFWEDDNLKIQINYEGTIAYTEEDFDEAYGIRFPLFNNKIVDNSLFDLFKEIIEKGLEIDEDKAVSYSCFWYNGSDSDMSEMTLEHFLTINGFK